MKLESNDLVTVRSSNRYNIEAVNEKELEFKKDYIVGEGALYTGQMKNVINN
jgi:hypothetical protein